MSLENENKIIEQYQALVTSIAVKYVFKSHHLSMQDLQQEGNIGLLKATRKFDPTRDVKFITYAYPWVKASISRAIREQGTTVRVPNHMYDAINKHDLISNLDKNKQDAEPVQKATRESDQYFLARTKKYLTQYDDCQVTDLRGLENSPGIQDVFTDTANKFLSQKLTSMVADLCFREKEVLKNRFPFLKGNPFLAEENQKRLTFKELGKELGITDSRAHQIEKEALEKLRWGMSQEQSPVTATA